MVKIIIEIKDNPDKSSCNVTTTIKPLKSSTETEKGTSLVIREKLLELLQNLPKE